jgi:DNA repair protein RadA/Sms
MEKSRTAYICQQCGKESLKWVGKCPNCLAWNSFLEQVVAEPTKRTHHTKSTTTPKELSQLAFEAFERFPIPMSEFNRVLGGGIVPGSLILISGEPGIGKSTLLLQASAVIAKTQGKVVYVSGEETPNQIKIRARRLGINGEGLFLLSETDVDTLLSHTEELQPSLLIIDSIQTVHTQEDEGIPGSITQVRQSAQRLMSWAKSSGVPVFVTGHVTKEGAIAGPRVLEHIVDVVLYLEGEQFSA